MMNSIKDKLFPSQLLLLGNGLGNIENDIVLDFLDVAASIFMEDVRCKVNSKGDPRNISVVIPVTDVDIWYSNKELVEKIVRFLSGDRWNIEFTKCSTKLSLTYKQFTLFENTYKSITLLSGGLDSFCGSYLNIRDGIPSVYCGYKINKFETHGLNNIHDILVKNYNIFSKRFNGLDVKKKEHTQRTRSFLFFALACICASMYKVSEINLYENGILSMNPELISRKTTKTTHPKTIYLMNQLFLNLGLDIHIVHPFLFKTKGEIIEDLSNEFKGYIKYTNTCGVSRSNPHIKIKKNHCGFCIPCILRKISMSAYDNEKYDVEYNATYETKLDTCDSLYKAEFKSSNEYFITLNERIKSGEILYDLNLKSKYYSEKNYLQLTKSLFERFSVEIEKYYSKYPI